MKRQQVAAVPSGTGAALVRASDPRNNVDELFQQFMETRQAPLLVHSAGQERRDAIGRRAVHRVEMELLPVAERILQAWKDSRCTKAGQDLEEEVEEVEEDVEIEGEHQCDDNDDDVEDHEAGDSANACSGEENDDADDDGNRDNDGDEDGDDDAATNDDDDNDDTDRLVGDNEETEADRQIISLRAFVDPKINDMLRMLGMTEAPLVRRQNGRTSCRKRSRVRIRWTLPHSTNKSGAVREFGPKNMPLQRQFLLYIAPSPRLHSEEGLNAFLYHEVCTHLLRAWNDRSQVWAAQGTRSRKQFFSRISGSRDGAATEEGLAVLNGCLAIQDSTKRWLHGAALLYYVAAKGAEMGFLELWEDLGRFVDDPRVRFRHCMRAKKLLRDTAMPGATGKGQVYLEGAVRILKELDSIDWPALYSGRVSMDALPRATKLVRAATVRLPPFVEDRIDKYREELRAIGELNRILEPRPRRVKRRQRMKRLQKQPRQQMPCQLLPAGPPARSSSSSLLGHTAASRRMRKSVRGTPSPTPPIPLATMSATVDCGKSSMPLYGPDSATTARRGEMPQQDSGAPCIGSASLPTTARDSAGIYATPIVLHRRTFASCTMGDSGRTATATAPVMKAAPPDANSPWLFSPIACVGLTPQTLPSEKQKMPTIRRTGPTVSPPRAPHLSLGFHQF